MLPIAAKHNVSILVVHHTRKAAGAEAIDEISGSFGLTGGVDGFLVMRRDRSGKGVTLEVDGRDIEDPKEYALHRNLNTGTWTIEGEAEEVQMSNERGEVLRLIRKFGPQSPKELCELTNKKSGTMRKLLYSMREEGQVYKGGDDRYHAPGDGNASGNVSNASEPVWKSQKGESVTGVTGVTSDTSVTLFEGASDDHRAVEALRVLRGVPRLTTLARQFFEGECEPEEIAGALATHHGEPERWKAWREPAVAALGPLDEEGPFESSVGEEEAD